MVDSLGQEDSAKAGAMQALEPARPGQVLLSHLISVWPWVSHWLGAVLTTCRQEPLPCGVITRIDGIAHQNHQARCQASWKKGCMKGMISGLIHLSGATWNPPVPEGRHIAKGNGEECQSPLDRPWRNCLPSLYTRSFICKQSESPS